jgi:hypothetical protein
MRDLKGSQLMLALAREDLAILEETVTSSRVGDAASGFTPSRPSKRR